MKTYSNNDFENLNEKISSLTNGQYKILKSFVNNYIKYGRDYALYGNMSLVSPILKEYNLTVEDVFYWFLK